MFGSHRAGPEGWVWMSGGRGCGPRAGRHGRPWWADAFSDPPPRAERGEIRYLVLDALLERPRHGYEIIQHIESRAHGGYRPSPGVIYPTLQMLEDMGHAVLSEQGGRKVYAMTDAGRAELDAHKAAVDQFYDRFEADDWDDPAEDVADLMRTVARLLRMFRRAARRGRMAPEVVRVVREALDEALRKIEAALDDRH